MPLLQLVVETGDHPLRVVRFETYEALSRPFALSLWALSEDEDVGLDAFVGKAAGFRLVAGYEHATDLGERQWTGVIEHMQVVQTEMSGASSYLLRIVPRLWLLSKRSTQRIFQHLSAVEIVTTILTEWHIRHRWDLDPSAYPKLEYRVQYGESDYDFVCRLLQQFAISYFFELAPSEAGEQSETRLVMSDRLHEGEPRPGEPLPFVDNPSEAAEREYITKLRLSEEVRPGRVTIRDFDFRLKPDYELVSSVALQAGPERAYEQYRYQPGALRVDEGPGASSMPVGDNTGVICSDEQYGLERASRNLAALRNARRAIRYDTNVVDIGPASVFAIAHPRDDLDGKPLLATELSIAGDLTEQWTLSGMATFAAQPYRPALSIAKPRICGVHSAMVVGPVGEEIFTDELGRVCVQFHWDREGGFDQASSCWMRVSQGWAGGAYGLQTIPRIGQEVLVQFYEGDPDQPVVVGRLFNATCTPPYKLPDHRSKSVWRSASSPGAGGYNEVTFEDAKGEELIYLQAQRNYDQVVKVDETRRTGGNKQVAVLGESDLIVAQDKRESVLANRHLRVVGDRREQVDGTQSTMVGVNRQVRVGDKDVLEAGMEIHLKAGTKLVLEAGKQITLKAGGGFIDIGPAAVTIQGAKVNINSGGTAATGSGAQPLAPDEAKDSFLAYGPRC